MVADEAVGQNEGFGLCCKVPDSCRTLIRWPSIDFQPQDHAEHDAGDREAHVIVVLEGPVNIDAAVVPSTAFPIQQHCTGSAQKRSRLSLANTRKRQLQGSYVVGGVCL